MEYFGFFDVLDYGTQSAMEFKPSRTSEPIMMYTNIQSDIGKILKGRLGYIYLHVTTLSDNIDFIVQMKSKMSAIKKRD